MRRLRYRYLFYRCKYNRHSSCFKKIIMSKNATSVCSCNCHSTKIERRQMKKKPDFEKFLKQVEKEINRAYKQSNHVRADSKSWFRGYAAGLRTASIMLHRYFSE